MTTEEAKAQTSEIWSLNQRTWYDYALQRSDYCAWIQPYGIENLPSDTLVELASEQLQIGVPTLFRRNLVSKSMQQKLHAINDRQWLTSGSWLQLTLPERSAAVKAWFAQSEIQIYSSTPINELPKLAQQQLRRARCNRLPNKFSNCSGPNCFAAAASAVSRMTDSDIHRLWLHWDPFCRFLKDMGYKKTRATSANAGDILLFVKNEKAVHAAYYLGEGFYFEKPGQDFYEPYRIERFTNWHHEWPSTDLEIWQQQDL